MIFQYAQGQAHGNQDLSKHITTGTQVNDLTAAYHKLSRWSYGTQFQVLNP